VKVQEHDELRDMLIEVRTRLDVLITQTAATHGDHEARIRTLEQRVDPPPPEDHERRLGDLEARMRDDVEPRMRTVERWVWAWVGAAAAGGGAVGTLLTTLLGV
jgi:hypothetical protein